MKLSSLIHAELDASEDRDPTVIARRIAMRLSAKDARLALAEALRDRVRIEMGRSRMVSRVEPSAERPPSKWERFRPLLDDGVFVDGEWKRMADCSADDFDWLAADRESKAAELSAVADRFRGYAQQMRKAGVATFAELHERDAAVAA